MGINIRNNIRKVDAKLVNATIDKYGASYPAQSPWRADGFNKVFVETDGANPTQKDFLEGNSSVYVYAIGSNIGSLLPYSLASFTNIKELYLFSPTMVNIGAIDNDYLTYLTDSDLKVYVPSNTLQSYITTYGGTGKHLENRFDEITDDYPLTVSGSGDLTSKELTNQLMNNYESVDRTNCTKLIIQGFTNASSVIWGYDFSNVLPNLNSNIWVNGVKFDFSVLNIVGSGTLTEVDIDNAISDIAISNRGGVLEVKISGYSDMSVALEYDYEDLPNLDYVWLDNVRYENVNGTIYQPIEYIESTGTQYTNTGFKANTGNIKVEIEMELTQRENSSHAAFGTYDTNNYYCLNFFNTSDVVYFYMGSSSRKAIFNYSGLSKSLYEITPTSISVNGVEKTSYYATSSNITNNFYLFGASSNDNQAVFLTKMKLYSCKFYDNNVLSSDLIPVLKNNEIGIYDKVNDVFYTNQGTGTFLKGNNIIIDEVWWGNKTYFYSLSNLETEYNANLNQTFYLDYNGTLPSYPNYQLTYYTDINCTTSILPENMQSGTRYYVKAVLVTL